MGIISTAGETLNLLFNHLLINLYLSRNRTIFILKKIALHSELPVYRDTYKLVLENFVSTKNFPKEYKL